MSKKQDPAFLMYSKDWLSGTAEYMPDEKGVYIDLLCHQHQSGSLPINTERLARMVGLSHEQFLKIWEIISCHFEQSNNRLVNRKLNGIIEDRAEKAKVNRIIGTFAGMLRLGGFSKKQYKYLKDNFIPTDFKQYPKEEITERITEWLQICLKSIEDGDERPIVFSDVVKNLYRDIVIFFDENCRPKTDPEIIKWLDTLDKLIRIDGYDQEHIINITKRTRMDNFWRTNFLTINKLRDKNKEGISYFTVFEKKMNHEVNSRNNGASVEQLAEVVSREFGTKN